MRTKQLNCAKQLPSISEQAWLSPFSGADRQFRNKAKLVVGGKAGAVTLGILSPAGSGVDLSDCLLYEPPITQAINKIATILNNARLIPYDVPSRRGELKYVHITASPTGELMVRFVVRSQHAVAQIKALQAELVSTLPNATVISVNVLPEHKAVLEGEIEVALVGETLEMPLQTPQTDLVLHLKPQSFFQTNTVVAAALYDQVSRWVSHIRPARLWDLYCGVGGFALHAAAALSEVNVACDILGVEISEAAIVSAKQSAKEASLDVRFMAGDAIEYALAAAADELPGCAIVNPPRRGIGAQLCHFFEQSSIEYLVYSSCNPETLARDLEAMPSFDVVEARVFDMFPHTNHLEVAVLLQRKARMLHAHA